MRETIRIQERPPTLDAAGDQVQPWRTVHTVRAAHEDLNGSEGFASAQRQARLTAKFRVRYLADLVPAMRVVWEGSVFDVIAVPRVPGSQMWQYIFADQIIGEAP